MALPRDNFTLNTKFCLDGRVVCERALPEAAGGYADVFKGQLGTSKVAIKVLRPFGLREEKLFRRLWREYLTWSRLSHPNILTCLGYSYDVCPRPSALPSLISPWMENGDVISYLQRYPAADRKSLLVGIASGLHYLHNHEPVIVHGDLRAGNILVSEHGIPCLTDFGLSRVIEEIQGLTTSSDIAGSVRWMSPELLNSEGGVDVDVTVKSDVWAYGMTALEILSGERPYYGVKNDLIVLGMIRDGKTPSHPQGDGLIDGYMWGICQRCWSQQPSARPAMGDVVSMIFSSVDRGRFSGRRGTEGPPQQYYESLSPSRAPIPMPLTDTDDPTQLDLVGQLNYYFSVQNLLADFSLCKQMDSRGWVPISVIASFVEHFTSDASLVHDVLSHSALVEVRGDHVRASERRWVPFVPSGAPASNIPEVTGLPRSI